MREGNPGFRVFSRLALPKHFLRIKGVPTCGDNRGKGPIPFYANKADILLTQPINCIQGNFAGAID